MVGHLGPKKVADREELSEFVWPVADSYRIENGFLKVEEPGSETLKRPLKDPELFSSFARLGARGEPTDSKILAWVEEHGLLKREDEERRRIYQARVNQAPMPMRKFKEEVRRANSAAHLYYALFKDGPEALKARIYKLREDRSSPKARPLAEIDRWLVENWNEEEHETGFGAANPSFRAYVKLKALVQKRVSGVKLSFFDEQAVFTGPPKGYRPTQAWYCPDLLSAIWLQLYFAMTGALPMKVCENPACRTPFPGTRTDKRFCTDTCRSNARHYR